MAVPLRSYALLITLSVIWGSAFVAIRVAVSDPNLSPINLTLLRWMIVSAAFVVLYPFVVKPKVRFERKDSARLLLVALSSVVIYHLSLNYSETIVDASIAGILISLAPLFAVVLSAFVLHEKVGGRLRLALVLAVGGAVVISSPNLNLGSGTVLGPVLVAVSSLASATNTVASKPLVHKYGPFPVAVWGAFVGTALLLPLSSVSLFHAATTMNLNSWISVLYLAILSTVVANLIFYTLVGRGEVSKLSVQLYLVPLVSVAGGALILGEVLSLPLVAGGAMLLLAVAVATRARG